MEESPGVPYLVALDMARSAQRNRLFSLHQPWPGWKPIEAKLGKGGRAAQRAFETLHMELGEVPDGLYRLHRGKLVRCDD